MTGRRGGRFRRHHRVPRSLRFPSARATRRCQFRLIGESARGIAQQAIKAFDNFLRTRFSTGEICEGVPPRIGPRGDGRNDRRARRRQSLAMRTTKNFSLIRDPSVPMERLLKSSDFGPRFKHAKSLMNRGPIDKIRPKRIKARFTRTNIARFCIDEVLRASVRQKRPAPLTDPSYNLSFTAASLRPELMLVVASHFATSRSWDETKAWVLDTNALQCRSSGSLNRLEREIRPRLQKLTTSQLELLLTCTSGSRTAISWLACLKHAPFLFQFTAETLRRKYEDRDLTLRKSDFYNFVETTASTHPGLLRISDSSLDKIRRVLLRMLREVEILAPGEEYGKILRPVLEPEVINVISQDDPRWLVAFLISDSELSRLSPQPQ